MMHVITTTLRESPRVLSGGLRECYRGVSESAIGGATRVLSGGLRKCCRGVEMVEKDLHPFYARKNLAMIKLSHI